MPNSPNSPTSPVGLSRLFHSYTRMSPSRSRRPQQTLSSHRAAHALKALKNAEKLHAQLTKNIPKLRAEYHKLVRRLPQRMYVRQNANMRTGPLNAAELQAAQHVARIVRNMSRGARTAKQLGLPHNLQEKIARMSAYA
jgi:hypothetical protein